MEATSWDLFEVELEKLRDMGNSEGVEADDRSAMIILNIRVNGLALFLLFSACVLF